MTLKDKKRIAHLEAVNDMAVECIKQIQNAMYENRAGSSRLTMEKIEKALAWFDKYGREK